MFMGINIWTYTDLVPRLKCDSFGQNWLCTWGVVALLVGYKINLREVVGFRKSGHIWYLFRYTCNSLYSSDYIDTIFPDHDPITAQDHGIPQSKRRLRFSLATRTSTMPPLGR